MSLSSRWLVRPTAVALVIAAGAIAQTGKDAKQGMPDIQLPPGWTAEDMQSCMEAATPGEHHQKLARLVGTWSGTSSMWMAPGMEPTVSQTTWTITSIMDGRFVKTDVTGDIPGMGPFVGSGIAGYDNVAKQYVSDWVDNCTTGIMRGTGEVSADGKKFTWTYNYHCPMTKKPATMREVMTLDGSSGMLVEMHGTDPKSGKEFKMMEMKLSKRS
ncbi:MAG: DUF1579 domain-containing protein [Planctomycetota bacterium]|nr:DUF1579 domain-containing protein [Planctomycetota bacterium]